MGMLCAPVRDERLAELKEETKVVPLFKGIMDLLEQMKLDMANFTIQQVRPVIVSRVLSTRSSNSESSWTLERERRTVW